MDVRRRLPLGDRNAEDRSPGRQERERRDEPTRLITHGDRAHALFWCEAIDEGSENVMTPEGLSSCRVREFVPLVAKRIEPRAVEDLGGERRLRGPGDHRARGRGCEDRSLHHAAVGIVRGASVAITSRMMATMRSRVVSVRSW